MSKIYKWLWTRIGGRPWTYIIRDFYHEYPWIVIPIIIGLGVLLGHLFFGTPYVPNQGG